MKIISSYPDYYDCIQRYYPDSKEPLYIREFSESKHHICNSILERLSYIEVLNLRFRSGIIYFCGKIYPYIRISEWQDGHIALKYHFNNEDIRKHVASYGKRHEKIFDTIKEYGIHRYTYRSRSRFEHCKLFFEENKRKEAELTNHIKSIDNKCPVILLEESYREVVIQKNPVLRNLNFQRIFPPESAYQEINMFLSNQAVPLKPIPYISDKDMVEAKGFDKFSFRNDKSK